jgi:uncharacterized membrane protein
MIDTNYILFLPALVSVVFLLAAIITYIFPPKKINYFYGYRTSSSMKSKETWDFAQKYSSIQMMFLAVTMFVISIVFSVFHLKETQNLIVGLLVLLLIISLFIYRVETALKIKFPK